MTKILGGEGTIESCWKVQSAAGGEMGEDKSMSGATMRTAVVRAFGEAPRCEEFAEPVAGEGEALVQVRAAPLKPVDKQLASGGHFAASRELLFVCGTDGVRTLSRWATGIFWRRSRAVARGHFVFRCRTVG